MKRIFKVLGGVALFYAFCVAVMALVPRHYRPSVDLVNNSRAPVIVELPRGVPPGPSQPVPPGNRVQVYSSTTFRHGDVVVFTDAVTGKVLERRPLDAVSLEQFAAGSVVMLVYP